MAQFVVKWEEKEGNEIEPKGRPRPISVAPIHELFVASWNQW